MVILVCITMYSNYVRAFGCFTDTDPTVAAGKKYRVGTFDFELIKMH